MSPSTMGLSGPRGWNHRPEQGPRGPPPQGDLGTSRTLWGTLPTGKAVRSRTQSRPAPTQFLLREPRGPTCSEQDNGVGHTTTGPPDSGCLHVETGALRRNGGQAGRARRWGLGIGRGNPATPPHATPRDGPAWPLHYPESLPAEGFSDPCFQGAGPRQARGQGEGGEGEEGVRQSLPPHPPPCRLSLHACLQQQGLRGKLATVPAAT